MELFIAGGCGEHGRNCFYLEQNGEAFLVDCGLLAGAEDNLPRLNAEQIQKLRAVFLTHSHADHTGALPWLAQRGYQGSIYATLPTLTQLPFSLNHIRALESLCPCKTFGTVPELSGLQVTWGRSGHCAGSVWLRFEWDEKSILFSGDYAEHSPLYPCDPLRSQTADLAVLDAAYGSTDADWNTCVKKLCVETVQCLKQTQLLFFPVPKYGRGPEILLLLKRFAPNLKFYGDAHFLRQVQQIQLGGPWLLPVPPHFADWVQPDAFLSREKGVVFLSGPQLTGKAGQRAREMVAHGALGIMTGTPDAGSLSAEMLEKGQMLFLRYPVHLDARQCRELAEKNQFGRVIPYHSPEIDCSRSFSLQLLL